MLLYSILCAGDESDLAGSDAPPHRHQIREVLPAASVEVCDTRVRLRLCSPAKKPPIAAAGSAPSGGSKDYSIEKLVSENFI